jgi:hypothetical protein
MIPLEETMANVYVEARPKGRPDHSPIDDFVVEDAADRILAAFKTQREAITWAQKATARSSLGSVISMTRTSRTTGGPPKASRVLDGHLRRRTLDRDGYRRPQGRDRGAARPRKSQHSFAAPTASKRCGRRAASWGWAVSSGWVRTGRCAIVFDRLADEENNPEFRIKFEEQAGAYRKIAANRAEKLGVELPEISN